jgi:hypothetical protein
LPANSSSAAVALGKQQTCIVPAEDTHPWINPRIDTMAVLCSDARPAEYQLSTLLQRTARAINRGFPHGPEVNPELRALAIVAALALGQELPFCVRALFAMAEDALVVALLSYATDWIIQRRDKYYPDGSSRSKYCQNGKLKGAFLAMLPTQLRWQDAMAEWYLHGVKQINPQIVHTKDQYNLDSRGIPRLGVLQQRRPTLQLNTLHRKWREAGCPNREEEIRATLKTLAAERDAAYPKKLLDWTRAERTQYATYLHNWYAAYPSTTHPSLSLIESVKVSVEYLGFGCNFSDLSVGSYSQWPASSLMPGRHDYAASKANRKRLTRWRAKEAKREVTEEVQTWRGALNANEENGFQTGPKRERNERRVRPNKLQEARLALGTTRPETIWTEAYFDPQEQKWVLRHFATYQRPVMKQTRYMQCGLGDKITEVGTDATYNLRSFKTRRRVLELVYSLIESPIGYTPDGDEITVEDYSAENVVSSEAGNSDWC